MPKSKFNAGMRSSVSYEWSTPRDFFDGLDAEFHFDLDVCATPQNAKCKRYFTMEQDALDAIHDWVGRCWMNPCYGRTIGEWVRKACLSAHGWGHAELVVCLLPARTDTRWWQHWICKGWNQSGLIPGDFGYADEVRLVGGRLKFSGEKNSAPFPSAVVIYRRS